MKTLKLFVLLVCFALAAAAGRPAPLSAAAEPVKAENVRFGYLVSDTNAVSGALGSWCGQNSPASELVRLDTIRNSIGVDLGTVTDVNSVTVVGWDLLLGFDGTPGSKWEPRLNGSNTTVYYSNDNVTYKPCLSYVTRYDKDTRMPHLPFNRFHFENLDINARYIKVHCTLDNNDWSWLNYQDRGIIVAGPAIIGNWYPQKATPGHRSYPWAASCLPFGSLTERKLACIEEEQTKSKFWFGGVSSYHPILMPQLLSKLCDARIMWRKVGFIDQDRFESSPGVYGGFEIFDKIIDIHKEYGFTMLGSFHGTANWNVKYPVKEEKALPANWWSMPANWQSYQDFVTAMVNRYKDRISFWEGWNEMEIPTCNQVTGNIPENKRGKYTNIDDFVTLQKTIYNGAKTADPNCVVLNGGFCGWGLYFLERVFSLGLGQYMDICGFHPYSKTPEGVRNKVLAVRDMLDYYGYVDMPIWVTEIGWSSGDWPADVNSPLRVPDEKTKAENLVKMLDLVLPHVQVVFWYSATERQASPEQRMFGLFVPYPEAEPPYLKENLAYTAYADYTKRWYKDHNTPVPPPPTPP